MNAIHRHQRIHIRGHKPPPLRKNINQHPRESRVRRRSRGVSTLVLCEVAWVLEAMGRQGDIKETLEKILSYPSIDVASFDSDDLIVGSNLMAAHRVDFNDAVNLAIMERLGIHEIYTNDEKHLGRLGFIKTIFE